MTYKYNIRKKAMKFIEKQEIQQRKRILKSIYSLPVTGDIKKLAGNDNLYRLRVGDYRILFLYSFKKCRSFQIKPGDIGVSLARVKSDMKHYHSAI